MNITIDITPRAMKTLGAILSAGTLVGVLAACSNDSAAQADQGTADAQLKAYQANGQSVHTYNHSQYRATLQDVEDYEAHGVATTSFDLNYDGSLNFSCPSIGEPVHVTDSLTNPHQLTWNSNANGVLDQMEQTGVFPGESSGTYVLCVAPDGSKYINYDEGNVHTLSVPAHWDQTKKQIIVDGDAAVQPTITPNN